MLNLTPWLGQHFVHHQLDGICNGEQTHLVFFCQQFNQVVFYDNQIHSPVECVITPVMRAG
jgi:hypothetical protein